MGKFQDDAKNAADRLGRSNVFMFNDEPCTDVVREQTARIGCEIPNQLTPLMEVLSELERALPTHSALPDAKKGLEFVLDLCRRMRGEK